MSGKSVRVSYELIKIQEDTEIESNNVYYVFNFDKGKLGQLRSNIKLVEIDCRNCHNAKGLWQEFGKNGVLYDFFGNNWDAFFDNIYYYEFWEEYDNVVIIFSYFEDLLKEEQINVVLLYNVIRDSIADKIVNSEHNKPPVIYIFNLEDEKEFGLLNIIKNSYSGLFAEVQPREYDD
jgi:hypothetical protein